MLAVPIVFKMAKKYNLYDDPGPRKMHATPIPRVGGISFVLGSLVLIISVFFIDNTIAKSFQNSKAQLITLLISSVFVYTVGLIDDIKPLRGIIKLLCLVVAAIAICLSGSVIRTINVGSWMVINTSWFACPLTILWIVGITICMGVIDGLDGLAAGIAAIVCGAMAIFALSTSQVAMAVLMLALLGGITGFLIFNFYPAKIFMGDGGSLFLGFMVGASSIICQSKTSAFVALALPLLVLGVPILDTGLVIAFRGVIRRRSLFAPDNNHIHHRLIRLGIKHRSAVILIYAMTAISASIGIFMIRAKGSLSVGILAGGIFILFTMFACLQRGRYLKLINGFRRNMAIAKQAKIQTRSFETAQVKMNEAESFESWWHTLCFMGQNMCFKSIALLHKDNGKYKSTCQWDTSLDGIVNKTVELNLPLESNQDEDIILRVQIYTSNYLELSGHQVKLLTRFLDEFPLPRQRVQTVEVEVSPIPNSVSTEEGDKPKIKIIRIDKNYKSSNKDVSNDTYAHLDFFTDPIKTISLGFRQMFKPHK